MNVWHGLDDYPAGKGPVVATIGNYDGVHLGHVAILRSVVAAARAKSAARSLLVTFDPHPLAVVAPERRPTLLQTPRQKRDHLARTGLDELLVVEFDAALAALDGAAFLDRLAAAQVELAAVHVGSNFRFGHAREGDLALLSRLGAERGFAVVEVPPVRVGGEIVSSSAVRAAIAAGDVERAAAFLGRPYAVEGTIAPGAGRGRELAYPTANLAAENELLPALGVYVTEMSVRGHVRPAVTNVGVRPTFGSGEVVVEAHLIDFSGDLYGEATELAFLARIREERRFADRAELVEQIGRDRAQAIEYFARRSTGAPTP